MPSAIPSKVFEPRRGRLQIDRRAWTCLERCRRKLRLDEIPLPIPVEDWIEGPLGIRFGFTDLSHLGDDILGAAYVSEQEILIDERVLAHEGRCRFTCAHELGHLTLHRSVRAVFHETSSVGSFSSTDRYERQADRFAAAFLMPTPLVEREILAIFDENKLNRADAVIEMMNPTLESEWLWRKRILPAITRRFDVSLSAAVNRFRDIQPRVANTRPLLPREFEELLLQPVTDRQKFDSIWVADGILQCRDLFSPAGSTT